jgi:arsenite methyltransferase
VQDLAQKLLGAYARAESSAVGPMIDFDERELFRYAEQAGFPEVQMDAHFQVVAHPESPWSVAGESDAVPMQMPWDAFVQSSPNPLLPTLAEAMAAALTLDEAERFTSHLRPLVESMHMVHRMEYVYLLAVKQGR